VSAEQAAVTALNRVCKWRTFFAGWVLGTRLRSDGPAGAVRDLSDAGLVMAAELRALARLTGQDAGDPLDEVLKIMDARIEMRVRLSAIVALLVENGTLTVEQINAAVAQEADYLNEALAAAYPGFRATSTGLSITMPAAKQTMDREGFPP
jgi:hypothetical protein